MPLRRPNAPFVAPEIFLAGLAYEIGRLSEAAAARADAGRHGEADKLRAEAEQMTRELAVLRPLCKGPPPSQRRRTSD